MSSRRSGDLRQTQWDAPKVAAASRRCSGADLRRLCPFTDNFEMQRGEKCASQIFPDLLVIVIVIVILSRVSLVQPGIRVGLYQGDEHRNDAPEAVFS